MKIKGYKGITLIALIITIIVLLILAGVTISAVVGENGILTQTIDATEKTNLAQAQEAIESAITDCLGDFTNEYNNGTTLTFSEWLTIEKLNTALKKENYILCEGAIDTSEISDTTSLAISKLLFFKDSNSSTIYSVNLIPENGIFGLSIETIKEATIKWYYDEDGNITDGNTILEVGSYVNYNEQNSVMTTYTSTLLDTRTTQTFELSEYLWGWRLLGVDEKTGEILLTSEEIFGPSTGGESYGKYKALIIYGKNGYAYGVNELNNICLMFGFGTYATGARSINVEDINRVTKYSVNTEDFTNYTLSSSEIYFDGSNWIERNRQFDNER